MVETLKIQHATALDLDVLALLFDSYRIFYQRDSDIVGARDFLEERMTNKESVIFVSYNGEVMTGFVQLYPIFSSVQMKRYWLLNDLFVHEHFRGQGISSQMIERVKEFCVESGACGFMLETAKSNVIANALYEKVGLVMDVGHNYYSWSLVKS